MNPPSKDPVIDPAFVEEAAFQLMLGLRIPRRYLAAVEEAEALANDLESANLDVLQRRRARDRG